MLTEHQVVKLTHPIGRLKVGAVGAIMMVSASEPPAYLVEFTDAKGITLELLTLHDGDFEVLSEGELEVLIRKLGGGTL
jgi:hypothetical protein